MAKDLETSLINIETQLGGDKKPRRDLGEHLDYIEELLEEGGGGGGGSSDVKPNPEGEILELNWAPKKGRWQIDKFNSGYPKIAFFGKYEHQPYLD